MRRGEHKCRILEMHLTLKDQQLKMILLGFPGGAVVKNPPADAGGHGFKLWSGKIPHAMEQLSP